MDRKELIRQYKETPRPMGVFRVHNTVADKSFVGRSPDLPSMLNRQRFQLSSGGHPNHALQEDWNRLGPQAFLFEILEVVKSSDDPLFSVEDELTLLEQIWIEKLQPFGEHGYNRGPIRRD